jgi:hypothetical protein
MESDMDLAWDLIGHDPLLRVELSIIEQYAASDDEMVAQLLEFFTKIERMIRLTEVIVEDDNIFLSLHP